MSYALGVTSREHESPRVGLALQGNAGAGQDRNDRTEVCFRRLGHEIPQGEEMDGLDHLRKALHPVVVGGQYRRVGCKPLDQSFGSCVAEHRSGHGSRRREQGVGGLFLSGLARRVVRKAGGDAAQGSIAPLAQQGWQVWEFGPQRGKQGEGEQFVHDCTAGPVPFEG